MLSRRTFRILGIVSVGFSVFEFITIWRSVLMGRNPPDSDSMMAFTAPILAVGGVSMLIFREDQLRRPGASVLGGNMTPLGFALFLLGLAAAFGNYFLVVHVAQRNH
jgi:hypothetical protein